jgi:hypothetical protein
MNSKKAFDILEIWVVTCAIITLVLTLVLVVYSIGTLSTELYQAFSPSQSSAPSVDFNINAYNSLGLQ